MTWWVRFFSRKPLAEHLRRGRAGESAARKCLRRAGLKFLAANFRGRDGEIDLVFRDQDCLVFVEVKTRSSASWTRHEIAVDRAKMRRISLVALEYLQRVGNPRVKVRFDIVEVLLEAGEVGEVRHIPHAFELAAPFDYF
jgi:putative endonuclease